VPPVLTALLPLTLDCEQRSCQCHVDAALVGVALSAAAAVADAAAAYDGAHVAVTQRCQSTGSQPGGCTQR